jgi:hypothetical protein
MEGGTSYGSDALDILQSRMAPDKSETFRKGKAGD